jgi:phage/plasmid-associated DNA primase
MDGLMRKVLGPLFTSLSRDVMLSNTSKSSEGAASPHLMALKGKRYGVYAESEEGEQINSAIVKQVTGSGDTISCRALHQNQTEFIPFIKIAMETNHLPKLNINDRAIVSRCRYIPFLARFSPDEREVDNVTVFLADQAKKDELMDNLDQWLTFLADGAFMCHQEKHLNLPHVLIDARDNYVDGQDTIVMFLQDNITIVDDEKQRIPASEMRGRYEGYIEKNFDRGDGVGKVKFGKVLKTKLKSQKIGGIMYYLGCHYIDAGVIYQ